MAAGAASAGLAHLYPDEAGAFASVADEAAPSPAAAGRMPPADASETCSLVPARLVVPIGWNARWMLSLPWP